MKNIHFLCILIIFLTACHSESSIERIENLTILHLEGTQYERGLAHGQFMKQEINAIIGRWKNEVEKDLDNNLSAIVDTFFKETQHTEVIKQYCPELLEEVEGIAEGSGIDYKTILAFQMSEEMDLFFKEEQLKHCTSLSINMRDSIPTLLAQNMDPPQFLHGFPTLLHIIDSKTNLQQFVYTVPGLIGLNGMNSEGVGITCTSISMLNSSLKGLPVAFIVRYVLLQESVEKAREKIRNIPVGAPQCFTIAGKKGAECFECSANEIKTFFPFEDTTITLHTNYAIVNKDFNQGYINLLAQYNKTVDDPYFCPRYFQVYDDIVNAGYLLNVEKIQNILSSTTPEIEPVSNDDTYGCLIMELGIKPVLHIAPGRPDMNTFLKLTF